MPATGSFPPFAPKLLSAYRFVIPFLYTFAHLQNIALPHAFCPVADVRTRCRYVYMRLFSVFPSLSPVYSCSSIPNPPVLAFLLLLLLACIVFVHHVVGRSLFSFSNRSRVLLPRGPWTLQGPSLFLTICSLCPMLRIDPLLKTLPYAKWLS